MKASNKSFQKKYNLSLVARSIWKSEGISRVDISKDIQLDKTSVSNIVSVLLDNNLIEVVDIGASMPKGGRKPVYLGINEDFGYVLGMDIQPDKCKIAVLSLKGRVVLKDEINILGDLGLEAIVDIAINRVKSQKSIYSKVLGCTIGMPGTMDSERGIVKKSEPFKILNEDLGSLFYNRYKIPFFMENDANCGAWGENFFNKKKNGNFIFLLGELNRSNKVYSYNGGIGVGLGLVIDNKVYRGFSGASGDFKSYHWKSSNSYQFGTPEATNSVEKLNGVLTDEVLEELLLNFNTIISVFNPERIVVGGDIGRYTKRINSLIKEKFTDSFIAEGLSHCKFIDSINGVYDVAIGAAAMLLELLFRIPALLEADDYSKLSWENLFNQLY